MWAFHSCHSIYSLKIRGISGFEKNPLILLTIIHFSVKLTMWNRMNGLSLKSVVNNQH